jgi:hypothetical protein
VNTGEQPFGLSPHGRSWGDTPWEEAYRLPGSGQLGMAKQLLMRYPWPRFEPHPEWVESRANKQNYMLPYAAGIPGQVRFIFCPPVWDPPVIQQLEPGNATQPFYSTRLRVRSIRWVRSPETALATGGRLCFLFSRIGFLCSRKRDSGFLECLSHSIPGALIIVPMLQETDGFAGI